MSLRSNFPLALTLLSFSGCCLAPAPEIHDAGGTPAGCTPPCVAAAGLTCVGGKCVCESKDLSPCPTASGGTKCTDLSVDPNCGSCGHVCDAESGFICRDGTCICGVSGYGFCPDGSGSKTCRNLQNDLSNCGACAHACNPGLNCVSGHCR